MSDGVGVRRPVGNEADADVDRAAPDRVLGGVGVFGVGAAWRNECTRALWEGFCLPTDVRVRRDCLPMASGGRDRRRGTGGGP